MRFILFFILASCINAFEIFNLQLKTINKDNIIHSDSLFEFIINVSRPLNKEKSVLALHWLNEPTTMEYSYTSNDNNIYIWSLYTNVLKNRPTKTEKTLRIHPDTVFVDIDGKSINIHSDASLTYVNSCILPNKLIGYDTDKCPRGLTKISDCFIQCQPGATAGNVELECPKNDDYFKVSGCSKRCVNNQQEGYIGCNTSKNKLTKELCDVKCEKGFKAVTEIEKICENDGDEFIFNGCERICKTHDLDYAYVISNTCMEGTESECNVICGSEYVDVGVKARCLSNGMFHYEGCEIATCDNSDKISCDDGIECTKDVCDYSKCLHLYQHDKCDDGIKCTKNYCKDDGCHIDFVNKRCDDNIQCTLDTCTENGCKHNKIDSLCDDNNVCTIDSCTENGCLHIPIVCDDGIPCTKDECDAQNGCKFKPDHDLCDDNIDCTKDRCTPFKGCVHVKTPSVCNDGIECTEDTCSDEGCTHDIKHAVCKDESECSTNICDPSRSMDVSGCVNTYNHLQCNDDIPCTKDRCTSNGCTHKNICLRSKHPNNTECVLHLEKYEDGSIAKPYGPCLSGETFSNCDMVEVLLTTRVDEIKRTELKQIQESTVKEVCNPNPCINSTCVNLTGSYECVCPNGQKGKHCEFLEVKEVPATNLSYILSLVIGIGLITVIVLNRKNKKTNVKKQKIKRKTNLKTLTFIFI